jgi:glutamate---cysteine ligase / carboxylate-amine ligase
MAGEPMEPFTLGVEEELHVVDLGSGDLVPRAPAVLAAARSALGDDVGCELNLCQVETRSPVCEGLDEVETAIRSSRQVLAEAAAERGLGVVALGTHPFGRWQDQRVDRTRPRYRALEEVYQELARQQIICGCHVHVGVPDRDALVQALTAMRGWLPVLLALSANSPFWQGHDTGYASFRQQIWRRWPTAGLPPPVYSAAEYIRVVEDLVASGAVPDESYLYWDARPSSRYPTLEVRVLDTCLDPDDAVAIAGLIRALVWTCVHDRERVAGLPVLQRTEVIESGMWSASRYGLSGRLWSPISGEGAAAAVVDELLLRCGPGLQAHGDEDRVTGGVLQILRRGTGAAFQRATAGNHGLRTERITADLLSATVHGTEPAAADVA